MSFNSYSKKKKFHMSNIPFYTNCLTYKISDNTLLEPSETVRDLGITFLQDLSWLHHISLITKKCPKENWMESIFKDRCPLFMLPVTLYKSLVRSHLEYACPLWIELSQRRTNELEAIQQNLHIVQCC